MSAHNGPERGADDSPVTRARHLSRFVRRLLDAEPQLLADVILRNQREDERHEEREQHHQEEVTVHGYFRPRAMSYASTTTSMLSRPATIRKALPYS